MRLGEIRVGSLHTKGKAAGNPERPVPGRATSVVALSVIDQSRY